MRTTLIFILFICAISFAQDDYLLEHVILENFDNGCSISAGDFNNDGYEDFVATSFDGNYIAWFENDGNQNFTQHLIIEEFGNARVLDIAHIDDDADLDIIATAIADDKISWFENDGSGNFTEHIIVQNWTASGFVMARNHLENFDIDFDNDGDTDILATSIAPGNRVSWFENDGNQNFTEHVIKENWYYARYCTVCDIDQDLDLDIVGTAKSGEIIIFENDGLLNFSEKIVIENWGETSSVQAADIDEDGDIDLAGTSVSEQEVAWFENDGEQNFVKHTIRTEFNGAFSVTILDIDADSDLDILSIAWIGGLISVFQNDGSENFNEYLFCDEAYDMIKIFPTDLDSDGDQDILGVCYSENDLRWWENLLFHLHPKIGFDFKTGHIPLEVNFFDNSSSSSELTAWEWDFDNDGNPDSYLQNPSQFYTTTGFFPVTLKVTSSYGTESVSNNELIHTFNGESSIKLKDIDDFIIVESTKLLNLTETFTVEIYCNIKEIPYTLAGCTILDKEKFRIYIPGRGFGLKKENSIVFEFNSTDGPTFRAASPKNTVTLNEWQQIALSFDFKNNKLDIYRNGELLEVKYSKEEFFDNPIENNESDALIIGNNYDKKYPLDGTLDELRIWNYAKSKEEITQHLNVSPSGLEEGLILYYNMNEGNGVNLIDKSNNNLNGFINNCEYWEGTDLSLITSVEKDINDDDPESLGYSLFQNYPNPFNPTTEIKYSIPSSSFVTIKIFDFLGKEINTLVKREHEAGMYIAKFNAHSHSSGLYFCRIQAGNYNDAIKMLVIK